MPTLLALTIGACIIVGCTTSQTTTAYKSESAIDASVVTAWSLWTNYAVTTGVPMATRTNVAAAFNKVKIAELLVVQSTIAASGSTNQAVLNLMTSNAAAESAALTDLGNLLASFNIKIQ